MTISIIYAGLRDAAANSLREATSSTQPGSNLASVLGIRASDDGAVPINDPLHDFFEAEPRPSADSNPTGNPFAPAVARKPSGNPFAEPASGQEDLRHLLDL